MRAAIMLTVALSCAVARQERGVEQAALLPGRGGLISLPASPHQAGLGVGELGGRPGGPLPGPPLGLDGVVGGLPGADGRLLGAVGGVAELLGLAAGEDGGVGRRPGLPPRLVAGAPAGEEPFVAL